MTNYCAVAGVTNNDTSSGSLQLVHNKPRDINNDCCFNNDDEIDNIHCTSFDNDNVILENEEVILPAANVPLVIIAENDDTNEYTNVAFDIRVEQKALEKRFSSMTLTSSKKMQIDLFHMLKASNAPLSMFDRIINLVQRHESIIQQLGTQHI